MSQTLQYKGYDGSVLYSAEDKMLQGRVLGVRDMISYGGTDVRSLEKNFCDAVDEYLQFMSAGERLQTPHSRAASTFGYRKISTSGPRSMPRNMRLS
jgi:predicted HicB family RNase H-like nuclease